jgi:hypothetical protein
MTERTWDQNFDLLGKLWVAFKPTPEQLRIWVDRAGRQRRQDWLREAIESHYAESERRREPDLRDILDRYSAIAQSGEVRGEYRGEGVQRWRAVWTQTIRGHAYRMSSRDHFGSEREAFAFAARHGTNPDAFRVGGEQGDGGLSDNEFRARASEIASAASELRATDRAALRAAVDRGRSCGLLADKPLPGRIEDWPGSTVLLVSEIVRRFSAAVT